MPRRSTAAHPAPVPDSPSVRAELRVALQPGLERPNGVVSSWLWLVAAVWRAWLSCAARPARRTGVATVDMGEALGKIEM